ncbi:hypothetical protein ANN_24170 [Periplaneta americana]|uniref:HAT C-terminal dimerisation domain-containing protein n=1 Tax=Periplaneta americana TaxID=6978 RepID=A0ABQ8S2L5_PERAM|nr:hypothetical protein ANN_24170 [Periplaneta americana]
MQTISETTTVILTVVYLSVEREPSVADFDRTISSLTSVPGNVGDKVNEKTANILSRNPGYYQLKEIQDILERKTPQKPTKLSIEQLTAFVQAPLTSCDVEQSFSRYKALLRNNWRRMTTENDRDTELAREGWKAWGKRWFPVHSPPALNDVSVARTQSHKTDTEYKSPPLPSQ